MTFSFRLWGVLLLPCTASPPLLSLFFFFFSPFSSPFLLSSSSSSPLLPSRPLGGLTKNHPLGSAQVGGGRLGYWTLSVCLSFFFLGVLVWFVLSSSRLAQIGFGSCPVSHPHPTYFHTYLLTYLPAYLPVVRAYAASDLDSCLPLSRSLSLSLFCFCSLALRFFSSSFWSPCRCRLQNELKCVWLAVRWRNEDSTVELVALDMRRQARKARKARKGAVATWLIFE
ncbi:hypothetical protein IWX90DRAFT_170845 [Phyllosticta citrichinensis]|uniref:Transmembrane protein n=1 Tax=Phyllosticta citrichinensis TaxID=1130410 RepID=A0ABR1Y188_9PEZI